MKILLYFIMVLAIGGNTFAVEAPDLSKVDRRLFDAAQVVVIANVLDGAEGSKYLCVKIEVLSVLKASPNVKIPSQMTIAYLSFGKGLPTGISTLYLIPYNPEKPQYGWKLLEQYDAKFKTLQKGYSRCSKG